MGLRGPRAVTIMRLRADGTNFVPSGRSRSSCVLSRAPRGAHRHQRVGVPPRFAWRMRGPVHRAGNGLPWSLSWVVLDA